MARKRPLDGVDGLRLVPLRIEIRLLELGVQSPASMAGIGGRLQRTGKSTSPEAGSEGFRL